MDYAVAVKSVYEHLDNDHVDKAVMTCLRIARNLQDFLFAAVFLREMYPNRRELSRVICEDAKHLNLDAQKFVLEQSLEYWLETHTIDFSLGTNERGEEKNILALSISEIDPELDQLERECADMKVPSGMGAFDTAAFADQYSNRKAQIGLRMMAMRKVKQQVKTRCLNYAIRIERELEAQSKSQNFLATMQTDVNNYFKAHCEDVYTKLQKAAQLLDSNDPEDCALLLTEIRRAIKASTDFLYPPSGGMVRCADGKERSLGEEQYLNRLREYLATTFAKSSSRDLLNAESELLSIFARRLHELASKGVHAEVSTREAKQGLLGLYMFLNNVISLLQDETS